MVHLEDLPPELLHHIIAHVSAHEDAHQLCLVSKRLHGIAKTYRKKEICFPELDRRDTEDYLENQLRYLIKYPHLQQQVDKISAGWPEGKDDFRDIGLDEQTKFYTQTCEAIQRLKRTDQTQADIFLGTLDSYASRFVILLALSPNLEVLRSTNNGVNCLEHRRVLHFLTTAAQGYKNGDKEPLLTCLTSIRSFSQKHGDTEGCADFQLVYPFLGLPNLQNIFGYMVGTTFPPLLLPEGTSACEIFEFWYSALQAEDMEVIFRVPRALKHFLYEPGSVLVSYNKWTAESWGDAFQSIKHSVETIYWASDEMRDEDDNTTFGSFADFKQLKYLYAPLNLLVGENYDEPEPCLKDILPSSLETFGIDADQTWQNVDDYDFEQMVNMLCQDLLLPKKDNFPNLKYLVITLPQRLDRHPETLVPIPGSSLGVLYDTAREAGVTVFQSLGESIERNLVHIYVRSSHNMVLDGPQRSWLMHELGYGDIPYGVNPNPEQLARLNQVVRNQKKYLA